MKNTAGKTPLVMHGGWRGSPRDLLCTKETKKTAGRAGRQRPQHPVRQANVFSRLTRLARHEGLQATAALPPAAPLQLLLRYVPAVVCVDRKRPTLEEAHARGTRWR